MEKLREAMSKVLRDVGEGYELFLLVTYHSQTTGVTILDKDLTILWYNPYVQKYFGLEFINTNYLDRFPGEQREATKSQLRQAERTGVSDPALLQPPGVEMVVERRIWAVSGGYIAASYDHTVLTQAEQRTKDVQTTLTLLAEAREGLIRDAQLKTLDMMETHCKAICGKYGNRSPYECKSRKKVLAEILAGRPRLQTTLTDTELEVARLYQAGHRRKEVAEILDVSEHTVKNHSTSIRKKLGMNNPSVSLIEYLQRFTL